MTGPDLLTQSTWDNGTCDFGLPSYACSETRPGVKGTDVLFAESLMMKEVSS
jgi:hypothetical protein